MKTTTLYGITATLLMMFSTITSAAHLVNPEYDFAAAANGNEHGALSINIGNVTATAYSTGGAQYYAYLDGDSGIPNHEAGLGVCKQITAANQCNPNFDDSIDTGEILKLSFAQTTTLSEIEFHDGNHNYGGFTGNVDISVDDGNTFVAYALTHILQTNLTGTNFLFRNTNAGNLAGDQFYVTAINTTPIPAAVWLFISGLGSLGFFRKGKKTHPAITA
jgi:hypothetical protein